MFGPAGIAVRDADFDVGVALWFGGGGGGEGGGGEQIWFPSLLICLLVRFLNSGLNPPFQPDLQTVSDFFSSLLGQCRFRGPRRPV